MKEKAVYIVRQLRARGYRAYLVGGCVRDLLLGIKPEDYDVATDATPDEIRRIFKKTILVGAKFGVVIVRLGGKNYEVATFRRDLNYSDGRHPEGILFSTPEEDAKRRDFTINALFLDPITKDILDFVGGQKDLNKKIIRAIGDPEKRFAEDYLRMLRAVRFAIRFGFRIEKKTKQAIKKYASEILKISRERIRDELCLLLSSKMPGDAIRLMDEVGLLSVILPEVAEMKGVPQPPQFHPEGDVFNHTLLMLDKMKSRDYKFALAVLLHDVGKPKTIRFADRIRFDNHSVVGARIAEEILRRLRFSNQEIKLITSLIEEHLKFINVPKMRESTLKKFLRMENFELHLELHRLDCIASHNDLSTYRFIKKKLKEFQRADELSKLKPKPLLSGKDLIEMGLVPGPIFKEILTMIEDMQLEGKLKDKNEAKEYLKGWLKEHQKFV